MPVRSLFRGLGNLLGEIPLNSIEADPNTSTTLEDLKTLTSYNLMPKDKRTIVVPGSPSVWNPRSLPTKIKADSGSYSIDPSRHVFPKCPLEPLLRALLITHPDFSLLDIDLISDRRNLRLLLDFINGEKKKFRIDIEVIGSTVLLSTWTERAVTFVSGFMGYGREFEKAWTKVPDWLSGSLSHHRVVGYSLGGMRVVMRFEVDGYVEDIDDSSQQRVDTRTTVAPADHFCKEIVTPTNYTILTRGTIAPASRIVEIKTGPLWKDLASSRNLAQLWFSQTPILCTAQYRKDGIFSRVSVKDVLLAGGLSRWEERNRRSIRKLVRMLEMVRKVARDKGGRCALVLPQGGRVLRVYELKSESGGKGNGSGVGVPPDLAERWGGGGGVDI